MTDDDETDEAELLAANRARTSGRMLTAAEEDGVLAIARRRGAEIERLREALGQAEQDVIVWSHSYEHDSFPGAAVIERGEKRRAEAKARARLALDASDGVSTEPQPAAPRR